MMKNIVVILCIFMLFIICGCDINNNPTSKVEEYLGKYQMLDNSIDTSYYNLVDDDANKKEAEELIKKQYRNLVYEIKDESIDGNHADVKTEVEVLNYKLVFDSNSNDIINDLKNVNDKITYTIIFNLVKDQNGKWHLNDISEDDKLKLLGMK